MKLDEKDKQLLNLLQDDASLSHKQIAAELNLTVTPVYERIKKLKNEGIITGIKAEINRQKVGKNLLVFCEVSLTNHTKENLKRFEKEIAKLSEVIECYHVSGKHDYMLKIVEKGMEEYRDFLINKLAKIPNVGQVNSAFVMQDLKESKRIVL